MKTIEQVNKEIQAIITDSSRDNITSAQYDKNCKRVEFLRWIIKYLETNPTVEVVTDSLNRVNEQIKGLYTKERYSEWCTNNRNFVDSVKNPKPKFLKETGVTTLTKQKQTLEFILGK